MVFDNYKLFIIISKMYHNKINQPCYKPKSNTNMSSNSQTYFLWQENGFWQKCTFTRQCYPLSINCQTKPNYQKSTYVCKDSSCVIFNFNSPVT